jgi:hypothetical protein
MNGLPPTYLLAFFFMTQIMKGNFRFLVCHNGRLHFAKIHDSCLQEVSGILQQLSPNESLTSERHIQVFDCVKAFLPQLSFEIQGDLVQIDWKDVIFAGQPGKRRTLKVILLDGQEAYAKYIGNEDELFLFEVIGTDEVVKIPLQNILDYIQPSQQVLEKYKLDLAARKAAELASQRDFENRKAKALFLQFPMALPRENGNHVSYPFLERGDLLVLFLLCQRFGFQLGNNYPFNNLLIRFQACGPQEKFFHEVPQLTESENKAFKVFERTYMENFMGNVMESGVQRCSKLTVQQVFLAQFEFAKHFKILSQCALSLPSEYFTNPEPEVVLRRGENNSTPHSSLEKLE